jgi:hypothetical protein
MSPARRQPAVATERRSLRSIRLSYGLTRWLLYFVVLVGVGSTLRFDLDPPGSRTVVVRDSIAASASGQWFAEQFVRAYLTWNGNPSTHEQALAPFLGSVDDPNAGLLASADSSDRVDWVEVAGSSVRGAVTTYTVAAQTSRLGLCYLDVSVAKADTGRPVIVQYPALVGAPAHAPAGVLDGAGLPAVSNAALEAMLTRALGNYLSGSDTNLAADLATGAQIAVPVPTLDLTSIQRLAVEPSGVILATVVAADGSGDSYTLGYDVDVVLRADRWEIEAIDPTETTRPPT